MKIPGKLEWDPRYEKFKNSDYANLSLIHIYPFKQYTLRYRMVVFDGEMEPEMAERYWYSFATQPKVEIN